MVTNDPIDPLAEITEDEIASIVREWEQRTPGASRWCVGEHVSLASNGRARQCPPFAETIR